MTGEELYMRRALELASLGEGRVQPNPMVGAVIVHNGRILGEGYHHAYGHPHAEVMAIRSVHTPELLASSTMYVSLEPCAHYGKTPPCVSLLIEHRIAKVVVAMLDPYPEVAGRGVQMLREAGIEVTVGMCEAEAMALNKPFVFQHTEHRPYFALKWAQSADGFMDRLRTSASERPQIFSSAVRQRCVHRSRMQYEAILIGYRTALLDDPSLTNRLWYGSNPLRIILDTKLTLPLDLRIFTDGAAPTWVLYNARKGQEPRASNSSVRYLPLDDSKPLAHAVAECLHREGVQSVLIEGGSKTLEAFLETDLADSIEREVSSLRLGEGTPAPTILEHTYHSLLGK
ncbi:MAG: bifunctional diaminohydroxyphosphoribosylaminopyrimidine deaminase/5-amino-6-(5-phosphoribosylamino)uracil reductase RibD [Porphyromonadaceae bacterium]|nr:bifunctional diaminohydroxyphosphoribosylaminopyrimidine deaminase/5-amino-6-(5-phosphoribosylamino)uracil reductase RibD [Porphyromonadaceae bacterium]